MKLTIYSADHSDGMNVDWAAIPRVGDTIVIPLNQAEKTYEVEVVRWLVDQIGNQIGTEVHMSIGLDVNDSGQGENKAASENDRLALAS